MNDLYAERVAKALESIADSLFKLGNPPIILSQEDAEIAKAGPGKITIRPSGSGAMRKTF